MATPSCARCVPATNKHPSFVFPFHPKHANFLWAPITQLRVFAPPKSKPSSSSLNNARPDHSAQWEPKAGPCIAEIFFTFLENPLDVMLNMQTQQWKWALLQASAIGYVLFIGFSSGLGAASGLPTQRMRGRPCLAQISTSVFPDNFFGNPLKKNSAQEVESSGPIEQANEIGTSIANVQKSFEGDEDTKRAYEAWRSSPYALTVPLRIVALRGSVPPIWIKEFILSQGRRMKLAAEFQGSLDKIYTELLSALEKGKVSRHSTIAADLVTIGDSWLGIAISKGLIVPLDDKQQNDWLNRLDPRWQVVLRRDARGCFSTEGKLWGAPYRCGCLVLAYRKDKLAKIGLEKIEDWADLWRPELAGKVSMVDSTREVIGMVLKSIGASFNTKDFEQEVVGGREAVKQKFIDLQKQVRVFDSVNYLKALGAGDVLVAVGWSGDVIPFAKRTPNIRVIAPASGTSLWADIWAIPAATSIKDPKIGGRFRGPSPLVSQWFDFCLQPARNLSFEQGAFAGSSPLNAFRDRSDDIVFSATSENMTVAERQKETVIKNSATTNDTNIDMGLPPIDIMTKSEFLQPLADETVAQYNWLCGQSPLDQQKSIFSIFWRRKACRKLPSDPS